MLNFFEMSVNFAPVNFYIAVMRCQLSAHNMTILTTTVNINKSISSEIYILQ